MDLFTFVSTMLVFDNNLFISRLNSMFHYYLNVKGVDKKSMVTDASKILETCCWKISADGPTDTEVATFLNLFEIFDYYGITPKFSKMQEAVSCVEKIGSLGIPRCFFRPFFKVLLKAKEKSLDQIGNELQRIGLLFPDQDEIPDRFKKSGLFAAIRLQKAVRSHDEKDSPERWARVIVSMDTRSVREMTAEEFVEMIIGGLPDEVARAIIEERSESDNLFRLKCVEYSSKRFKKGEYYSDRVIATLIGIKCIDMFTAGGLHLK